jgi:hypothetical protein
VETATSEAGSTYVNAQTIQGDVFNNQFR